jgi:hypothetical protein
MGWLSILKPVIGFARAINRLLVAIPMVDDLESRVRNRFLSPIVVRRVIRPNDPDLHSALELYEKRLDGDLRFESADIVRWLADDRNTRGDRARPHDYFVVAKYRHKVKAFALFHYYPLRKTVFLAYMVVDGACQGLGLNDLSQSLVAWIANFISRDRLLRDCQGLLFEVEDPRKALKAKQLHNIARIQRFCTLAASQKFSLRAFEIDYLQPAFHVPEPGGSPEQPLLLLSARLKQPGQSMTLESELIQILDFIYLDLYPEGFSDIQEENESYKAYCRNLHDRVIQNLPSKIQIINPIHLTCGRSVRKASMHQKAGRAISTPRS